MAKQDGTNVAASRSLHLDLDCGTDKAEEGKGYTTASEARAALTKFVEATGLPQPMVVCSGYGLHVYWPLGEAISKENWLRYANKLKALTKERGLLADPSVTADIVRILRVPGSKNYKHGKVANVTFDPTRLALVPHDLSEFVCLLDHGQANPSELIDLAGGTPQQSTASTDYNEDTLAYYGSALMAIPVAEDRPTWLQIGMAIHALGWGEAGYKLWEDWSRNSEKFDEEDQLKTWQSFDCEREAGAPRIGVGTLIKMAKDNEWRPAKTSAKTALRKLSANDILKRDIPQPDWLLEGIIRVAGAAMIYGPPGIGKSWLTSTLAVMAAHGRGLETADGGLKAGPQEGARVLIYDGEMVEYDIKMMLNRLSQILDMPDHVNETFANIDYCLKTGQMADADFIVSSLDLNPRLQTGRGFSRLFIG